MHQAVSAVIHHPTIVNVLLTTITMYNHQN